jgi:hypothetical protein
MHRFISQEEPREDPVADLVEAAIDLAAHSTYADFYFNPLFGKDLPALVPQLGKQGFIIKVIEIEKEDGTHASAELSFKGDVSLLDLGELVLTGEDVTISEDRKLQPIGTVINFIRSKSSGSKKAPEAHNTGG